MPESGIGHDDVGVDRRLAGEPLAHPHARAVQLAAAEPRVGPGEVDELEDAQAPAPFGSSGLHGPQAVAVDDHQLARGSSRTYSAPSRSKRARLRGEHVVAVEPSERERTDAVRIAEAGEAALGEQDDRVRALELRHGGRDRFLERPGLARRSSAAITSVSDVDAAGSRAATSSSRSAVVLVRLPLCPIATARPSPCWTLGWAFVHIVEPVVE